MKNYIYVQIERPETCRECPLCNKLCAISDDTALCQLLRKFVNPADSPPDECPLLVVPTFETIAKGALQMLAKQLSETFLQNEYFARVMKTPCEGEGEKQ